MRFGFIGLFFRIFASSLLWGRASVLALGSRWGGELFCDSKTVVLLYVCPSFFPGYKVHVGNCNNFIGTMVTSRIEGKFFGSSFFNAPGVLLPLLNGPLLNCVASVLSFCKVGRVILLLSTRSRGMDRCLGGGPAYKTGIGPIVKGDVGSTLGSLFYSSRGRSSGILLVASGILFSFSLDRTRGCRQDVKTSMAMVVARYSKIAKRGLIFASPSNEVANFSKDINEYNFLASGTSANVCVVSNGVLGVLHSHAVATFSGRVLPRLLSRGGDLFTFQYTNCEHNVGAMLSCLGYAHSVLSKGAMFPLSRVYSNVCSGDRLPYNGCGVAPPIFVNRGARVSSKTSLKPCAMINSNYFVNRGTFIHNDVVLGGSTTLHKTSVSKTIVNMGSITRRGDGVSLNDILYRGAAINEGVTINRGMGIAPGPRNNVSTPGDRPRTCCCNRGVATLNDHNASSLFNSFSVNLFYGINETLNDYRFNAQAKVKCSSDISSTTTMGTIATKLVSSNSRIFSFNEYFLSRITFFSSFYSLNYKVCVCSRGGNVRSTFCKGNKLPLSPSFRRRLRHHTRGNRFHHYSTRGVQTISSVSDVDDVCHQRLLERSKSVLSNVSTGMVDSGGSVLLLVRSYLLSLNYNGNSSVAFGVAENNARISTFYHRYK